MQITFSLSIIYSLYRVHYTNYVLFISVYYNIMFTYIAATNEPKIIRKTLTFVAKVTCVPKRKYSKTMVKKIEKRRRTVNIGKL